MKTILSVLLAAPFVFVVYVLLEADAIFDRQQRADRALLIECTDLGWETSCRKYLRQHRDRYAAR